MASGEALDGDWFDVHYDVAADGYVLGVDDSLQTGGVVLECDEENNAAEATAPSCP